MKKETHLELVLVLRKNTAKDIQINRYNQIWLHCTHFVICMNPLLGPYRYYRVSHFETSYSKWL